MLQCRLPPTTVGGSFVHTSAHNATTASQLNLLLSKSSWTVLVVPCVGAGGPKSIMVLFDSHISMVECGRASTIGDAVARGLLDDLPEPLRFRDALPAAAKVEIIVSNLGDGLVDVVKIVHFDKAISAPTAAALCRGQGFAPVFRPGPWAVKKAVQWLLNRLPGYHVRWSSLEPKPETVRKSQSQTWSTDDDNLAEGIRFINKNAPECDAQNEQTYWVLTCIKPDSGTPVAGWPEVKVRAMAQNKSRGVSGAQSMTEFPLTTFSLHPVMHQHILPYLYPLLILMTSAIVLLGSPGVGKTPALIVMAMAMGRFHIRRLGLSGVKPGWRRAKSLDNFRHRVSQVQEALFLDDPSRSKIDIADLKSFVTVDEEGTCQGRYNDSRLARNQMRAVASNDIVQAEPRIDPASTTTISPDAFFDLIEPVFRDDHVKDKLAVMKRASFFVFSDSGLFIRLPSEKHDAIIHRVVVDDVHKDLLASKDKPFYNHYKNGTVVYGPDYEQELPAGAGDDRCLHGKFVLLRAGARIHQSRQWSDPEVADTGAPPSCFSGVLRARGAFSRRLWPPASLLSHWHHRPSRLGTFDYPGADKKRRLREKTSCSAFPTASNARDTANDDGDVDTAAAADAEELSADAEAAAAMHTP